ncbi:MAG: phosphoribosylamine--glycine ligase [Chloroflexi bacterium]|nr:phosphoribosylamine--glycine ligase [Chloroflexota bacterium]
MRVLVIGSGAREHTIVWKLLLNPEVRDVFVAPGNGGTHLIARNLDQPQTDFWGIAQAVREHRVDLVIVGPEGPLVGGLVDFLAGGGVPVFGPTQAAARIEGSKGFAKDLMQRYGIPCARSQTFDWAVAAHVFVDRLAEPIVVKADGLAAGKGVTVAFSREEAHQAIADIMERRVFGDAGERVVIEEYLEGQEYSFFAVSDGETVVPLTAARDYKRAFDGDQGPNTGGMGSYGPPAFISSQLADLTMRTVMEPTIRALAREGSPYRGVLYAGMMLTRDGPKVLEFNCRFGDPETQVVLPRMQTDLAELALACVDGRLSRLPVTFSDEACVGVVLASAGYPEQVATGLPITGLDRLDEGVRVFHAATRVRRSAPWTRTSWLAGTDREPSNLDELLSGQVETAGGRVLTVVSTGPTVAVARRRVYENIARIRFEGAFYRTDIAAEAEES